MESFDEIDLSKIWKQLQAQAKMFEYLRINFQKQYQIMDQSLLSTEIRNPLQEQMQSFEYLNLELQKQFWALEQLRLRTETLSPTLLEEQATRLKLMLELMLELEQLKKLMLRMKRLEARMNVYMIIFMLLQLPVYILLELLSLILLPLIIQASKFLPEEANAEFAALHQRLKRSKTKPIYIKLRIAWHFLEMLWAFHIQIKIENLWLSKKSTTRQDLGGFVANDVTTLVKAKGIGSVVVSGGLTVGETNNLEIDEISF